MDGESGGEMPSIFPVVMRAAGIPDAEADAVEQLTRSNESIQSALASTTRSAHEYVARRSARLDSLRVFGVSAAAVGMCFTELQTPVEAPIKPAAALPFEVFRAEGEAGLPLEWVRSLGLGAHEHSSVPERYAAVEQVVDKVPTVQTASEHYRMLLHQEAVYRRHLVQDCDVQFSCIFESFYDGMELLRMQLHELVTRYWLVSDRDSDWNSLSALAGDAAHCISRAARLAELGREEDVARDVVLEAFLSSHDALLSEEVAAYLKTVRCERTSATSGVCSSEAASPPPRQVQQQLAERAPSTSLETTTQAALPPPPPSRPPRKPQAPAAVGGASEAAHRHSRHRLVLERYFLPAGEGATTSASAAAVHAALLTDFVAPVQTRQLVADSEEIARRRIDESYASFASALASRLRRYTTLITTELARRTVAIQEEVQRGNIVVEYFFMMLAACEGLEVLQRRELLLKTHPRALAEFRYEERQAWLRARKAESARFTQEELDAAEADKQLRDALMRWSEARLHAKLALNREEMNQRLQLLHDEASHCRVMEAMFEDARSALLPIQIEFELEAHRRATTIVWSKSTYDAVYLREAQHRTSLMDDEQEEFGRLKAAETSCYLATRRAWLTDCAARDMLAPYDEFERDLSHRLRASGEVLRV